MKSLQNVARTAASRRQQFNAPCVLMPSNLVSSYWLVAWSTTNKTIKVTHIQPVQQPAALHDVCSTTCSNGRWSTNLSTTWREAGVVVVAHRLQIVVVKVGRTGLTVLSSIIYTWDDLNLPPPLCGWGWCLQICQTFIIFSLGLSLLGYLGLLSKNNTSTSSDEKRADRGRGRLGEGDK